MKKAKVEYVDREKSFHWQTVFDHLESVLAPTDVTYCWILRAEKKTWLLSPSIVAHVEVMEE